MATREDVGHLPQELRYGGSSWLGRMLDTLTLQRSFRVVFRSRMGRTMVASVAILYAFGSMLLGGMLELARTGYSSTAYEWIYNPYGPFGFSFPEWWNYPALLVVAPGGLLILPFFATITMVLVSLGVGVGMSVGIVLTYRVLRDRRRELRSASTASTLAGLTPAMIALVTLGACCSTAAAATAGVGVVAETSGRSVAQLLANSWYLGVFQMGVLFVALVAQEQLLSVFQNLLPRQGEAPVEHPSANVTLPSLPWRVRAASASLRIALLAAGVTWSLAMFSDWIVLPPTHAGAGSWVWWIFEHQVPALIAVALSLTSTETLRTLRDRLGEPGLHAARAVLLVSGLLLLTWVPASAVQWGMHGWINEVLGAAGAPASWGAVSVGGLSGVALALRWAFQFVLLGTFAILFALVPERALRWLSPRLPAPTPPSTEPSPVPGEAHPEAP